MSRLAKYGAALAAVILSTSGCYQYTPVALETIPPGDNVRVYVTRQVMLDLEEALPMEEPILRGMVARRENDQIFLRVPVTARQIGFHSEQIAQEVPIPAGGITQVERREFNRVGTGMLAAGTAAAAAVVLFVIMEAYSEPEFEEECPDCADMRLPILSIPLR